ncbi:histone-like nucleoid-structuring protein Lsr2 [Streptomyces sp. NPDC058463]|uniref:Lsr2 family DNA-binding protein n=1 Tax=Streptomyces sp. NPDC058463 TaxID=3346510 RepID=UPI0036579A24
MTGLNDLTRICPPPDQATAIHWDRIEADLGMPLPQDYKELADRYGPGTFNDYLRFFHPHGVTHYVTLTGPAPGRIRAQLRKDYDQDTHPVPYEPDTLFACGATDNGEYLFWITDPATEPDLWHIAVNEARGPGWFTYEGNATAFLVAVLGRQPQVPLFPPSFAEGPAYFTPSRPPLWKPPPFSDAQPVDTGAVRSWARANGYDVPSRGRIPPEIREAWERTTSGE